MPIQVNALSLPTFLTNRPGQMEGLVDLGGASEPKTWYHAHTTAGTFLDCAPRHATISLTIRSRISVMSGQAQIYRIASDHLLKDVA